MIFVFFVWIFFFRVAYCEEPEVKNYVLEPEKHGIFSTIRIDNQTYAYDVELAMALHEANIEFSLKDLIDYSNLTYIQLLASYDRAKYETGILSVITNIPKQVSNFFVDQSIRSSVEISGGKVKTFYNKISYAAFNVPKSKIKELVSRLPKEVKGVYVDSKVQVFLNDSVPIIKDLSKQSYVEEKYGKLDGSGIKIAILDTGIDKTHPDLDDLDDDPNTNDPKIVAEQSFVGDNNPSDGFGHGTHVASIASGTGQASNYKFVGVAPKSKLLNAKVLNDYGYGYISDIIKGIEWSVDNGANVMSMSFGSSQRNKPLEDAVKEAINKDVIAVVAAGNKGGGNEFWSIISSPGVVEDAITVGATDKKDLLAYFSSKGPTDDLLIKPDLVAPGVDICAANVGGSYIDTNYDTKKTCGNDKYVSLSGTSMATPHVSGAVALILQAHPSWTPDMVKSALIGTAKDLDLTVYEQGGGRIDAYDAINTSILIDSSVINMGNVLTPTISDTNFTVTNIGNDKYGIKISVEKVKEIGTMTAYNFIGSVSNNNFCLVPNENKTVKFTIDTSQLVFGYYSGFVRIDSYPNCDFGSTPKRLNLPLGFSKLKEIEIKYITPQVFAPDEIKYHGTWFIEKDTGRAWEKTFWSENPTERFFTTQSYFDVFVEFFTANKVPTGGWYGDKWKLSYIVKQADLRNSNKITLDFNENDAREIKSNVNDILASKNMDTYIVDTTFTTSMFSRGWTWFDSWAQPFFSKEWHVALNTDNSINKDYVLRLFTGGKEHDIEWNESKEYVILPMTFYYPFSNLQENILEAELRSININFYDSAKYTDTVVFGVTPYSKSQFWIFSWLTEINYPPATKKVTIRDLQYCDNCNYLVITSYFNANSENFIPSFDVAYWNGGNFPGLATIPSEINILEKPLDLNLSSHNQYPYELLFMVYDKYRINIGIQSDKGTVNVIRPDGKIFSESGNQRNMMGILCDYPDYSFPKVGPCQVGNYKIDWKVYDIIKGQNIRLTGTANWDGSKWTILKVNTQEGCVIPDSPICNVNSSCQCEVTNCNSGWLRTRLPDNTEFTKYFTSDNITFNPGTKAGSANAYISCIDDGKEYSFTINVQATS